MQAQSDDAPRNGGRRTILMLGAVALGLWGVNRLLNRSGPLEFSDIPGAPGFRMLRTGEVSGGIVDPLIGLDAARPAPPEIADAALCGTLFAASGGGVPVASFSDYYCPYCRVLTRELSARAQAGRITVTWHELPLLGETSEIAARAALAADMQGAYPEIHARLMRSRVVATDAYLRDLAGAAGLDPGRFIRDARSAAVQRRIDQARGLAARFGFFGTPALVIGRTAVLGAVSTDTLDRLIADEEKGGQTRPPVCP